MSFGKSPIIILPYIREGGVMGGRGWVEEGVEVEVKEEEGEIGAKGAEKKKKKKNYRDS